MKQFISITVFMSIFLFFTPIVSQAAPLVNVGTVFQGNLCFECESLEQANLSVITQNIKLGSHRGIPNNSFLIIDALLNIAFVDQNNFCENCQNVDQINSSAVIQNIDLPQVSMTNHGSPVRELPHDLVSNIADVVQDNICEQCQFIEQVNSEAVTQNITLLDPSPLDPTDNPAGFPLNIFSNFATVSQFNFCTICDGVSQSNFALVVQNISAMPGHISSMPEPGTIFLLGSGLIGLGLLRFAKSKRRL